jgi:hypothetical protein
MMDAIGSVTFNLSPVGSATAGPSLQTHGATSAAFDISHFNAAYATAAQAPPAAQAPEAAGQTSQAGASESAGFRSVIASLEGLNGKAQMIGAQSLQIGDGEMKPSDMLMLTMKAQEFMFHCELTANVANRTSDGVQQLFREQS